MHHDSSIPAKIKHLRLLQNYPQVPSPSSAGKICHRRNCCTAVQDLNRPDLPYRMLSLHGLRPRQRHQPLCQLRRFSANFRSRITETSRLWQMVQTLERQKAPDFWTQFYIHQFKNATTADKQLAWGLLVAAVKSLFSETALQQLRDAYLYQKYMLENFWMCDRPEPQFTKSARALFPSNLPIHLHQMHPIGQFLPALFL